MLDVRRLDLDPGATRLVVLGDPHGDIAGAEAIFAREDGPEVAWLCVGDAVGKADGPTSSEMVAWLRARGVATVRGNHEQWVHPDGALAVLSDRHANPYLSPEAIDWCRALPDVLEIFGGPDGKRVAAMVHSHREPRWRDVEVPDARRLVDSLGGPRVLLIGHSHRPRILELPRGAAKATLHPLDFRTEEERALPFPADGTLVVDAGSVAEPKLEDVTREHVPRAERAAFATYAVIDLVAGRAAVRAVRA